MSTNPQIEQVRAELAAVKATLCPHGVAMAQCHDHAPKREKPKPPAETTRSKP